MARLHPDRLVLAADQTLDLEGSLFMKPVDRSAARMQMGRLRGKAHHLHSASALRRGETVLWAGISSATLIMRPFDDAFLDRYLDAMGAKVTETVGGYEIEGLGPHLFSEIVGDHATILGLPLFGVLYACEKRAFWLATRRSSHEAGACHRLSRGAGALAAGARILAERVRN